MEGEWRQQRKQHANPGTKSLPQCSGLFAINIYAQGPKQAACFQTRVAMPRGQLGVTQLWISVTLTTHKFGATQEREAVREAGLGTENKFCTIYNKHFFL